MLRDERCPYCFSKFSDEEYTHDPIVTYNGSKYMFNEETGLLEEVTDVANRFYRGMIQIRNIDIKELQDKYDDYKPEDGWTPVQDDANGIWVPNKVHIRELREAIEQALGITEATTEEARETILEQYFNYDETGTERRSIHQKDWIDNRLTESDWKGQIKNWHIEDLRHYISLLWFQTYWDDFTFSYDLATYPNPLPYGTSFDLPWNTTNSNTRRWSFAFPSILSGGFAATSNASFVGVVGETENENYIQSNLNVVFPTSYLDEQWTIGYGSRYCVGQCNVLGNGSLPDNYLIPASQFRVKLEEDLVTSATTGKVSPLGESYSVSILSGWTIEIIFIKQPVSSENKYHRVIYHSNNVSEAQVKAMHYAYDGESYPYIVSCFSITPTEYEEGVYFTRNPYTDLATKGYTLEQNEWLFSMSLYAIQHFASRYWETPTPSTLFFPTTSTINSSLKIYNINFSHTTLPTLTPIA